MCWELVEHIGSPLTSMSTKRLSPTPSITTSPLLSVTYSGKPGNNNESSMYLTTASWKCNFFLAFSRIGPKSLFLNVRRLLTFTVAPATEFPSVSTIFKRSGVSLLTSFISASRYSIFPSDEFCTLTLEPSIQLRPCPFFVATTTKLFFFDT